MRKQPRFRSISQLNSKNLDHLIMPSTKGKPTDPELHDKVTEEIKQQPNKDGERQDVVYKCRYSIADTRSACSRVSRFYRQR